jgi:hypothetical protein
MKAIKNNPAEIEALNNALISLGLTDYEILKDEMTGNRYCLRQLKNGGMKCLTGWWNYEQLNHYIMGYGKAFHTFAKQLTK